MQTQTPQGIPLQVDELVAKAGAENFPVASRLLPRAIRGHLLSTYAYARLIDDIGDLAAGDRLAQLDWAEAQLRHALSGEPAPAVFGNVAHCVRAIGLSEAPYLALIEANRMDQRVTRYASYAELERYCSLSANPIGRIVLAIFSVHDVEADRLSDQICTGLQLVEHWQDVAEDYHAGRVYLPLEDLQRFSVPESDLGEAQASAALRRLLAFETNRARALIESGRPLLGHLPLTGRVAIAGFIGGGLAQIARIETLGFDTLAHRAKASKSAVLGYSARTLLPPMGSAA